MFICTVFELLKFRMLINLNLKFNVQCTNLMYKFNEKQFYNSCCIFNKTMLKHQLAGSLSKKTLTIKEKLKLLDANKKTAQSCRQLADQFCIGKTAATKFIKNEVSICQEYEHFKGNLKRKRTG